MNNVQNMNSNKKIEKNDKWALVTGASSGLGRECAHLLARAGKKLVLCAEDGHTLNRLSAKRRGAHRTDIRTLAKDLSRYGEVMDLLTETEELDIDTLVHAQGHGTSGPFLDSSLEKEVGMLHFNVVSTAILVYEFGTRMKNERRGNIVLIGPIPAHQRVPNTVNYSASKAYLRHLVKGLSEEFAVHGTNVLMALPRSVGRNFNGMVGNAFGETDHDRAIAREILRNLGKRGTLNVGHRTKLLWPALPFAHKGFIPRILVSTLKRKTENQSVSKWNER